MNRNKKKFWLAIPCIIAAIGLFIWFFQWLWNILLPDILGVKAINYWQSLGILVLSKILFGGFGGKKKFGRRHHFDNPEMKENWKQKLETQFCGSDEEREKFKEMWKQRFESRFCKSDGPLSEHKS